LTCAWHAGKNQQELHEIRDVVGKEIGKEIGKELPRKIFATFQIVLTTASFGLELAREPPGGERGLRKLAALPKSAGYGFGRAKEWAK
jgi:hypothetical protein